MGKKILDSKILYIVISVIISIVLWFYVTSLDGNLSTKTIENVIRHSTGMTFSKYQMDRKLEMIAVQIEVEPEIKLSELSAIFGFCDEFHLSKAFKKKFGVAPSVYKKQRN